MARSTALNVPFENTFLVQETGLPKLGKACFLFYCVDNCSKAVAFYSSLMVEYIGTVIFLTLVSFRRINMEIKEIKNGSELTIMITGRLDTRTAPELESRLGDKLNDVEKLIFDISGLEYISSAGLRVLLAAYQTMEDRGEMIVRGASMEIIDIFKLTGFADIFNLE